MAAAFPAKAADLFFQSLLAYECCWRDRVATVIYRLGLNGAHSCDYQRQAEDKGSQGGFHGISHVCSKRLCFSVPIAAWPSKAAAAIDY